jgi:Domain of unknown function (DUF4149)
VISDPRNYNGAMFVFVVRQIGLVALAVWLGGMSVLGLLAAPTTFRVLETADPHNGRVLAGALFGEILRGFHLLAYACGLILLISLLIIKFVGPPPRAFKVRIGIVTLMLAIALYSGVPLTRTLASLQSSVAVPINTLPETDPRRHRFDRLHATSTALWTVNIALGLISLAWYARE